MNKLALFLIGSFIGTAALSATTAHAVLGGESSPEVVPGRRSPPFPYTLVSSTPGWVRCTKEPSNCKLSKRDRFWEDDGILVSGESGGFTISESIFNQVLEF